MVTIHRAIGGPNKGETIYVLDGNTVYRAIGGPNKGEAVYVIDGDIVYRAIGGSNKGEAVCVIDGDIVYRAIGGPNKGETVCVLDGNTVYKAIGGPNKGEAIYVIGGGSSDSGSSSSYSGSGSTHRERPDRERPSGFLGWAVAIILFFIQPFIDLFSFRFWTLYTATRKDWWGTLIRMVLFVLVFSSVFYNANQYFPVILLALSLIPIVAVSIARMHDIGRRGWWFLIPVVGFVMCGFFPSRD